MTNCQTYSSFMKTTSMLTDKIIKICRWYQLAEMPPQILWSQVDFVKGKQTFQWGIELDAALVYVTTQKQTIPYPLK